MPASGLREAARRPEMPVQPTDEQTSSRQDYVKMLERADQGSEERRGPTLDERLYADDSRRLDHRIEGVLAEPGFELRLELSLEEGKTITLRVTIARLAEAEEGVTPAEAGTPALGLQLRTLTPRLAQELGLHDTHGVLVRGVEDGSPAAGAGIQPGDVIAEIDHRPVKSVEDLQRAMGRHAAGTPTLILVHRHDGNLYVAIGS